MSLKRRDIIAWLLLLAAALVLSLGNVMASNSLSWAIREVDEPFSSEAPQTSSDAWFREAPLPETGTASDTEAESLLSESDRYPGVTAAPTLADTTEPTEILPTEEGWLELAYARQDQIDALAQRYRRYGTILIGLGVLLAGISVFAFRQRKPFVGPDGYCILSVGLSLAVLPTGLDSTSFLNVFLCAFVSFAALRELWGWVRVRCRLDWCVCERLVVRFARPRSVPLRYLILLVLPLLLTALLPIQAFNDKPILQVLRLIRLLSAAALILACLLRYYRSALEHFQTQLDRFRTDADVEVREGPYGKTEEKLRTIQTEHREAVARAVADERFRVDLIANVSHDLRTPLTAILGYGELLEKQPMSEEGKTQLSKLNRKAGYMRDLVESLFELTKVSSGVLEPKQEPIDLVRLLEQTVGFFDDPLTAAGLTVKRQYASQTAPLNSDGTMLHQVFSNLLGNAIKYALKGTRIYLELTEAEGKYLVRMVNTASYEMDFTAEEIVQRFARGDKARSTQGSGLGLAIAQTYAEALGGSFEIVIDGDQFNAIVTLPKTERNL